MCVSSYEHSLAAFRSMMEIIVTLVETPS